MAGRQAAAEFGDGGVVVGQLLLDRQRLAELGLRLRRLARVPQQDAEVVVAIARSLRNSVTAGLSSASFCWIASALRYSASASAGLPVSQQRAEVVVADRQAAAEFGDGGVVVGQLLLDRQRRAVLGLRLRRLARVPQQDADAEDRVRQVAPGVVGGFGGGGQRLLVGPRQPVGRQGVGGLGPWS